jgi:hypothetical protein
MEEELLRLRMQQTHDEIRKNLNTALYGDREGQPLPKKTVREKLSDLKWRIQAAWLVLRGRADIC